MSPKATATTDEATIEATDEAVEQPAAEEPEEKPAPKKRGRPRKNPEPEDSAEDAADKDAADDDAEKKPAPKKTAKKTTTSKKSAPKDEEKADEEPATEEAGDEDAEGAPTRRRRSRTVKKVSDEGEADAESASASEEDSDASKDAKSDEATDKDAEHSGGARRSRRGRRGSGQRREIVPSTTRDELVELPDDELTAKALELEVDPTEYGERDDLVSAVYDALLRSEGFVEVEGILDLLSDGYGFIRTSGYLPGEHDAYVGMSVVRRNGLRRGDYVCGRVRPPRDNEKYPALNQIEMVNGEPFEGPTHRVKFSSLTPIYPDERLTMEHGKDTITARIVDLVAPIGKGQRGLIVSPPKAGKTTVLKDIAAAISANNPEVHLMCLLVDERPEEVTDMERSIKGEVISSTFDMPCENHIAVAELVIERAKRLVENGKDVVILLDSITRLARAYNLAQPASGRILSGGVDSSALYPPKRFLGAARNIEFGGSLTILGTALIDTGSKMDEVIFEEFKGTGNMELRLDRNLADRRIFPAIDPVTSGTRKEELLLDPQESPLVWGVRRLLANMNNTERAMDMLIKSLKQTETNQEFLVKSAKKAAKQTQSTGQQL